MRREDVLEYERRRALYVLIQREPGLHMRELERRSELPLSTLRHHLRYLEVHKLIDLVEDRNVVRYFASADMELEDKRALAALRQRSLRNVLLFLLRSDEPTAYKTLLIDLGVPPSTLAVYLSELSRRGLVERRMAGRESRYAVVDRERVIRLLHTYRASLLDSLVDHLLDAVYKDEG